MLNVSGLRSLVGLMLLSSTLGGAAAADAVVIYRATPQTVTQPAAGSGTGGQTALSVTSSGSTVVAYGDPWSLSFSSTGTSPVLSVSGTQPSGISIANDGRSALFSGRTFEGSYPFTATAVDADGKTTSASATVVVAAPSAPFALAQPPASSLSVASGASWNISVGATGGRQPYSFDTVTGLPTGVQATAGATGIVLTGTGPAGTHVGIAVGATDFAGRRVQLAPLSVVVDAPLAIAAPAAASLNATSGMPFAISMAVTGGRRDPDASKAYSFSISPPLPGGTSLVATSAGTAFTLTGTAAIGSYGPFTVKATDKLGATVTSQPFSLRVAGETGMLYAIGMNTSGALGDGTTTNRSSWVAVTMPNGVTGFSSVSSSEGHTCGIASDGKAYCWGANSSGQLGIGTVSTNSPTPTAVLSPAGVDPVEIVVGETHTCMIGSDAKAYCWGAGQSGQLGNGVVGNASTPTLVSMPGGTTGLSGLSLGLAHTCAIGSDGKGYCWGSNSYRQLGTSTSGNKTVPTLVVAPGTTTGFSQIATGYEHSCGIASDGYPYCWGNGSDNQLGTGTTANASFAGSRVGIGSGSAMKMSSLTSGHVTTCGAATSDGRTYCWGRGTEGSIGDNGNVNRNAPYPVTMTAPLTSLSAMTQGVLHACAMGNDAKPYCWGYNSYGKFADGTQTQRNVPKLLALPAGVSSISKIFSGPMSNQIFVVKKS